MLPCFKTPSPFELAQDEVEQENEGYEIGRLSIGERWLGARGIIARIIKYLIIIVEFLFILNIVGIWDTWVATGRFFISANFLCVVLKMIFLLCLLIPYSYRVFNLLNIDYRKHMRLIKIISIPILVVLFVYAYTFQFVTRGFCHSIFNDTLPGVKYHIANFSSAFIRGWYDRTCPNTGKPWMVYATLPEDALTGVFINIHIHVDACGGRECRPNLSYRPEFNKNDSDSYIDDYTVIYPIKGEYKSPEYEYDKRNIYTAYLKDLKPNTTYTFFIEEDAWKDDKNKTIYSYKTFDVNNMVIIDGGDMSSTKIAETMNKNVVNKIDADLIMIGGDIAYDNNIDTWFHTWDHVNLNLPINKEDRVTNTTRVIPVIFASGNHDLGVNSYSGGQVYSTPHGPVFKHYYPQNTNDGRVPELEHRRSFFAHHIGEKLSILSLDTGYESPMEGDQTDWIDQQLTSSTSKIKIAQFHGPIITAWKQDSIFDQFVIENGKKFWLPLFDRHNMTIVFENHTHVFKRSKRVKNGKEDEKGTYYLGEGNWGVTKGSGVWENENKGKLFNAFYYIIDLTEKVSLENSVWVMHIDGSDKISANAYNTNGDVLDSLEITY